MEKFNLENLIKEAKKNSLSENEKGFVKAGLLAYMKNNPSKKEGYYSLLQNLWFKRLAMPMVAVLIVVGLSYQAEASLPGDILYGFKIKINEEVRGFMASKSPESRIEWEIQRMEKRIDEAQKLAISGDLTENRMEKIELNIEKQADRVSDRIALLDNDNTQTKAIVSEEFKSSLENKGRTLNEIKDSSGKNGNVARLITKIEERLEMISGKDDTEIEKEILEKRNSLVKMIKELKEYLTNEEFENEEFMVKLSQSQELAENIQISLGTEMITASQDIKAVVKDITKEDSDNNLLILNENQNEKTLIINNIIKTLEGIKIYIEENTNLWEKEYVLEMLKSLNIDLLITSNDLEKDDNIEKSEEELKEEVGDNSTKEEIKNTEI